MHFEHDGLSLWYGTPDAPAPRGTVQAGSEISVTVCVAPVDASNKVEVLYRLNRGPQRNVSARWQRNAASKKTQYYEALLGPFQAGDTIEYATICTCAGRSVPSKEDLKRANQSFRVIEAASGERRIRVSPATRSPVTPAEMDSSARAETSASATPTRLGSTRLTTPRTPVSTETGSAQPRPTTGASRPSRRARSPINAGMRPIRMTLPARSLPTVDPWRSLGIQESGEWSVTVQLLDGSRAELVRRLRSESGRTRLFQLLIRVGQNNARLLAGFSPRLFPLYSAENLPDEVERVVLFEGVPATNVLRAHEIPAVGTLTGPTFTPSLQALARVAEVNQVVLWPGKDAASRQHLLQTAALLARLGINDLRVIPSHVGTPESAGGDAQAINAILDASPRWDSLTNRSLLKGIRPAVPTVGSARLAIPEEARPRTQRLVAAPPIVRLARMRQAADELRPLLARAGSNGDLTPAEREQLVSAARELTDALRRPR